MSDTFVSHFQIKIDGSPVSQEFMNDVLEIVVDTSLVLPEMFTIRLLDDEFEWVDNTSLLKIGAIVEISAQASEELGGESGLLMKGEITGLEPDFSAIGKTTFLIRGYHKAHRLHRGRQTRTFLNQTDKDIVSRIANEVGLTPTVDNTSIRHDYILQKNQTNMEFLQARAKRLGFQVFAAEGKLYFKKGEATLGTGPTLELKGALRSFRPSLLATHQVDKFKALGWDAKQKQQIVGESSPNSKMNQGGIGKTGGDVAQVFGGAEAVIVDQPVSVPDEAKALADGLASKFGGDFIQAEGVCLGHPKVKAGYKIEIAKVGSRFSGQYFVTSAAHIWTKEGYETHFTISGQRPNTVSHLLENDGHREQERMNHAVVGVVTNTTDPDNLGRVKVKFPWLGDDIESDWARVVGVGGGSERGMLYIPEVNDEVLVVFEHGDTRRAYVIGGLWNSRDKPPLPTSEAVSGGKVNKRIIKSRTGHVIILDDTQGSEQIIIRDQTGSNEVVIDSAQNNITLNTANDFKVSARGNITLEATKDVSIKGMNLKLEGNMKSELKGAQVAVNGSGPVNVKGAVINLN